MSAYLVDHQVIQVLATFITQRYSGQSAYEYEGCIAPKYTTVEDVAEILAKENLRSLDYRYSAECGSRLSGADEFLTQSRESYISDCQQFVMYSGITDADLAKLFSHYEYQACEHPDYWKSDASVLVSYGEKRLLARLANKSESWGLPESADIRPVTDIAAYLTDREFQHQMDKPI